VLNVGLVRNLNPVRPEDEAEVPINYLFVTFSAATDQSLLVIIGFSATSQVLFKFFRTLRT
jgi:hypothetical protein